MAKKTNEKKKLMFSRYKWIMLFLAVFSLLIIGKLAKTTMVDADEWNNFANKAIKDSVIMYPERGSILADDGSILASSVTVFSPRIDLGSEAFRSDTLLKEKYLNELCDTICKIDTSKKPGEVKKMIVDMVNAFLDFKKETDLYKSNHKTLELPKEMSRKYAKLRKVPLLKECFHPELVKLTNCTFFKKRGGKYTLDQNSSIKRKRPYGNMAAQCIGATTAEIKNGQTVFTGTRGLERALNGYLYGQEGLGSTVQATSRLRTWEKIKSIDGYDVKTTINVQIQDIVETELSKLCEETESEWGTAIVMEVATGDIKAISNLQRDTTKTGKIFYREGMNRAIMGFEPGSVIKPISMLIALENKVVGPHEFITTGSSFAYAHGKPIHDSHAFSGLTPSDIITASSNIGMAKVTIRGFEKNPAQFIEEFRKIGMFDSLKLGIYGERIPKFPPLGKNNWDRIDMTRVSFGYNTEIPPIYTLAFYNAIANGGKLIRPRLVKELIREGLTDTVFETSYIRERICSEDVAALLRNALRNVVWDDKGTGRALRNNFVSLSGKTGTAYTLENGNYNHAKKRLAFCGFFPSENPKYSCIVLMNKANRGAARSSGMVMMNVALKLYARGMLGKDADYKKDNDNNPQRPVVYSMSGDEVESIKNGYNISGVKKMECNVLPEGVPSVIGMGLRNAIRTLENAGLNVERFSGNGYVYAQSLKPGAKYKEGDKITLSLK